MEYYLMDLRWDVSDYVVDGMKNNNYNTKYMKEILIGLFEPNYETAKDTWDKLQCIYDEYAHTTYEIKKSPHKEYVHKESKKIEDHNYSSNKSNHEDDSFVSSAKATICCSKNEVFFFQPR